MSIPNSDFHHGLLAGGGATTSRQLVWVDRQGNEELVAAEPREYQALRLSPDGGRAAVVTSDDGNRDVLIYDLDRDIPTRFTFDDVQDNFPVWSPDGNGWRSRRHATESCRCSGKRQTAPGRPSV